MKKKLDIYKEWDSLLMYSYNDGMTIRKWLEKNNVTLYYYYQCKKLTIRWVIGNCKVHCVCAYHYMSSFNNTNCCTFLISTLAISEINENFNINKKCLPLLVSVDVWQWYIEFCGFFVSFPSQVNLSGMLLFKNWSAHYLFRKCKDF